MSFKRRMNQKTDYAQRLELLKSGKPRLVIRKSLNNIHIQVITIDDNGDKTALETFSKNLQKYGWKGHGGNLSAAYLTGYLAGLTARRNNIKEAVADIGLHTSVRGSGIYAAVLGAKDAGLSIGIGKEAIPSMERISGKHIADYASNLKPNQGKYKRQFSAYLKKGFNPEELPKHFEEVKKNIESQLKVEKAKT